MSIHDAPERPVALVTGAGSGIGRAVAVALAASGHDLALVGRRADALETTIEAARAGAPDAALIAVPADLAQPHAPASVVATTVEHFGRLHAIVNNAGYAALADVADTTIDTLETSFSINSFAPALLVAAAWPVFVRQGHGRVINISSMATFDPFPGFFVYAAAKAALESMTRSIQSEGRRHGIRAWSIAPGAVETAMLRGLFPASALPASKTLAPDTIAAVVVDCLLGRRDDAAGTVIPMPNP
ncbi:MAG: SDR family oxidoreductase [Phycisphaerales bacterium]|nr:SDR family oxidoreductase [Phycisphaerales bacterium]